MLRLCWISAVFFLVLLVHESLVSAAGRCDRSADANCDCDCTDGKNINIAQEYILEQCENVCFNEGRQQNVAGGDNPDSARILWCMLKRRYCKV